MLRGPVDEFRDKCSQSLVVEEKHPHPQVSTFLSLLGDKNEGMPSSYIKIYFMPEKEDRLKISLLKRPGC